MHATQVSGDTKKFITSLAFNDAKTWNRHQGEKHASAKGAHKLKSVAVRTSQCARSSEHHHPG